MGLSNMRDDKKIQGYLIFWPLKKLVVDETWLACVDGIESFSNLSISAATFVLARLPRHSCLSSDVTESNTHSAETAIMSFILVVGSQGSGKRALIQGEWASSPKIFSLSIRRVEDVLSLCIKVKSAQL